MTGPRVLIVQPLLDDGPAFLATWLRERGVPFDVCSVQAGDTVPVQAARWQAVAMLGGTMSVNDDLPFLHSAAALLRDAVARGVPVLGHCLGGQMLAKVLGARVTDNPVPEIGWSRIEHLPGEQAQQWLGDAATLRVYQWHQQTFSLPPGATQVARNAACENQAFAFGPHLGMQFHVEVDAEKLDRWCREAPRPGDPRLAHASVQHEAAMRADTARHLAQSQATAARLYARWLALAGRSGDDFRA